MGHSHDFSHDQPSFQDVRPLRSLTWILTSRNLQRDVERWVTKMIQSAKFTWYLNIMCWKTSVESAPLYPLWSRLDVLFISCLKHENSIYINYLLSDMESPSRLTLGHQRKVVLGMLGEILCKHKQPKRYCSTAWSVHNVLLPAEWRTLNSSNIEASTFRILQKLQAKNPWILFVFKKLSNFPSRAIFRNFLFKKNTPNESAFKTLQTSPCLDVQILLAGSDPSPGAITHQPRHLLEDCFFSMRKPVALQNKWLLSQTL